MAKQPSRSIGAAEREAVRAIDRLRDDIMQELGGIGARLDALETGPAHRPRRDLSAKVVPLFPRDDDPPAA